MGGTQTGFTEAYAQSLRVKCGLAMTDLAICFLFVAHCIKLFSNSTMHDKVMSRTETVFTEAYAQSFKCEL